jgi:hypothetical protein
MLGPRLGLAGELEMTLPDRVNPDLVGRVPAFKSDGQPADDPGSRPSGRLATIANFASSPGRR